MTQRSGRIDESQCLEPLRCGLRRQPRLLRRQSGDRVEQRTVEELLVQPPDQPGVRVVVPAPRLEVLIAARAGKSPQVGLARRQQVGAAELMQLQPVLNRAQEPVRRRELGSIVATDIAAGRQSVESDEGRRTSQALIAAPVHELQKLYCELDVAETTRPELHLAIDLDGRQVVEDATAHRLHVGDESVPVGR
jgi:hypothetical protein